MVLNARITKILEDKDFHLSITGEWRVGLYHYDAMSSSDAHVTVLNRMLDQFETSDWYPVASGKTLEEAMDKLDKRLEFLESHPELFNSISAVTFQYADSMERDQPWAFAGEEVDKLYNN